MHFQNKSEYSICVGILIFKQTDKHFKEFSEKFNVKYELLSQKYWNLKTKELLI